MFINRESELAFLEDRWHSNHAELIPVYGRRRVGKTALLRAFCARHPHVYWVASLTSEAILRRSFSEALVSVSGTRRGPYERWEDSFRDLGEAARAQRLIVVIDEFPYLVAAEPSLPSVLQRVWDELLQHTRLCLILCGSQIGMMEQEVLVYRAPLYGRRTGQIDLRSLPWHTAVQFMPRYTPEEQVEAYAVFGGIPAYLTLVDDHHSLLRNIESQILNPRSYLYNEPLFLLREELHEPRHYMAVLQALANGRTRLNEIMQSTGLERGTVSRYLDVLQDLRLIERRVPATERHPHKSRRGLYRLSDPFLRFWFRFAAPHQSLLEEGNAKPVLVEIERELAMFVGPAFEELCREWVSRQGGHKVPFIPERVGGWWNRDSEIDVVAINWKEQQVLLGEAKWSQKPLGLNLLDELQTRASQLPLGPEWKVRYALFSRAGFTPTLVEQAQDQAVLLVDLATLLHE